MKHSYKISLLLFLCIFAGLSKSHATIYTVTVSGLTFSPASVNVLVGDTIRWQWGSGSHTTTSTSVPGGAATWDQAINSSSTTFSYKITSSGTYNYKCTPHEGLGMVGSFVASTPLPIGLSAFSVSPMRHCAQLKWSIAPQSNQVVSFEVERSSDGKSFTTIGKVKAVQDGTDKSRQYDFMDHNWKTSMNYYRLKMKEKNGEMEYSIILSINNNFSAVRLVHLAENPVLSDKLTLHVADETKSDLKIQVTDISGKLIADEIIGKGFSGELVMQLGEITAGTYILKVIGTGTTETTKFIKK